MFLRIINGQWHSYSISTRQKHPERSASNAPLAQPTQSPDTWSFARAWRGGGSVNRRANNELAELDLIEHILCLVHIAPDPGRRRHSTHHWMLRIMEMFGGVLARRRIATANVAARSAFAKSDPKGALA